MKNDRLVCGYSGETDDFSITIYLYQRPTPNSYLFTLTINVLAKRVKELIPRCIFFEEDVVLLGESNEDLNKRLNTYRRTLETHGFCLNRSKMKYIECKFNKMRSISNI